MHRAWQLLALGLVGVLAAGVGIGPRFTGGAAAAPSPEPSPVTLPIHFAGAGSCASTACHNAGGPRGARGSEYTTWVTDDPHARAYAVLFDPRSRRIQENLNRSEPAGKGVSAPDNPVCLRCHALDPGALPPDEHAQLADGVGCESCHGPAGLWKGQHYLPGWRQLDPRQREALGFRDTKDLTVRARVCVECHVGSGDRDVNHDLIAAGHPRLRFEYGGYLANYPKHWSERADKARYPDLEARAWLIGQLVSAAAAADLLRDRASRDDKPWPEFAEYGCFSCHHELREPSVWRGRAAAGVPAGSLAWNSWYVALLPELAHAGLPGAPANLASLTDLERLMARNYPDRRQAAQAAGRLHDLLSAWLAEVRQPGPPPETWYRLLPELAGQEKLAGANWDSAAQVYLGIAALHHGLSDLDPRFRQQTGVKAAVKGLGAELQREFPNTPQVRYDSPVGYDPHRIAEQLRGLREELRQFGLK